MAVENSEREGLGKIALEAIDNLNEELYELNQKIWSNPEVSLEEVKGHQILTNYLEGKGFEVTRHYTLPTAFQACSTSDCPNTGPVVGIICEYDALPDVGHACGHNLIAEAGVAAGIGIKKALESINPGIGQVVVLGCPAEESKGGKCLMLNSGCFDKLDFCMMVHPSPWNAAFIGTLAGWAVTVDFKGLASHAASHPWVGVNALDAAVLAYTNISVFRQQMKPDCRIMGVVTKGGVEPYIIPDKAGLQFSVRAPTTTDLYKLKDKVTACMEGAAQATGCEVEIKWSSNPYLNLESNSVLARIYERHGENFGFKFMSKEEQCSPIHASTDMGNVSKVKPSIHPWYEISTSVTNHTRAFTAISRTKEAHERTLNAAKAMALTALDVLQDKKLFEQMNSEFNKNIKMNSKD